MGRLADLKRLFIEPSSRRELVADERALLVLVGVLATFGVVAVFSLHLALTSDPAIQRRTVAILLAAASVGAITIAVLPWNRLLPTLLGEALFYAWSVLDTVLIAAYVRATGGGQSVGYVLFFLVAAFNAAAYRVRGQVALLLLALGLYLPLAGDGPPEGVAVRVATLVIFVYLAANLGAGRRGRALADERSTRVAAAIEADDRQVRELLLLAEGPFRGSEQEVLAEITSRVEKYMEGSRSAAALFHREDGRLELLPPLARSRTLLEVPRVAWERLLGSCDTATEPPPFVVAELQRRLGHGPMLVASFRGGGLCAGLLAVGRELEGRPFDERERKRLARLARAGGLVVQNAWLTRQLDEQARHDPLTGLFNVGAFRSRLEEEIGQEARYGGTLALVVAHVHDLDEVRSGFGPLGATTMVRRVAAALASAIRLYDVAARTGKAEFSILAPGAGAEEARALALRLSEEIVRQEEIRLPRPSVSIGIAVWPLDADTADGLVAAAQRAAGLDAPIAPTAVAVTDAARR